MSGGHSQAAPSELILLEPENSVCPCILSPETQKCHLCCELTISVLVVFFSILLQILNIWGEIVPEL